MPPLLLDCSQQPTFVDPQAAICWSANLQLQIKSTFKMGSLIGRGSGESFQPAFHGPGFVVVQPSGGQPVVASARVDYRCHSVGEDDAHPVQHRKQKSAIALYYDIGSNNRLLTLTISLVLTLSEI